MDTNKLVLLVSESGTCFTLAETEPQSDSKPKEQDWNQMQWLNQTHFFSQSCFLFMFMTEGVNPRLPGNTTPPSAGIPGYFALFHMHYCSRLPKYFGILWMNTSILPDPVMPFELFEATKIFYKCFPLQVVSWKSKLPLQTIMRLLQVLVPQVEKICIDK